MLYCLNPQCSNPKNQDSETTICMNCGSAMLLQDRYVAIKPIAQGGFGRTFLAVDRALPLKPRRVIKQFFPKSSNAKSHALAVRLFQQEAVQLEKLGNHAQIPRLIAHFEQNAHLYLIQEYIDGRDLSIELQDSGPFSEDQIWQVLRHLLPILKFIHRHQVIHRDIKPANIIRRSADNSLVLVDLGAAKYSTGEALAQTGTVIGSAEYTSPEQARGKALFASDIYSLGVTCVHLLTDISPFNLFDTGDSKWIWRDYLKHPISGLLSQTLDRMILIPTNHRVQTIDQIQVFIDTEQSPQSRPSTSAEVVQRIQLERKWDNSLPTQREDKEPELEQPIFLVKPSGNAPIIEVPEQLSGRGANLGLIRHANSLKELSQTHTQRISSIVLLIGFLFVSLVLMGGRPFFHGGKLSLGTLDFRQIPSQISIEQANSWFAD